jgi:hypothetical protein
MRAQTKRQSSSCVSATSPTADAGESSAAEANDDNDVNHYELISNHLGMCLHMNKVKPQVVTDEERQDVVGHVVVYLQKLSRMTCFHRDAKYSTTCTCLNGLDNDEITSLSEAVGELVMLLCLTCDCYTGTHFPFIDSCISFFFYATKGCA